jgi:predicted CXXCH cytochrome family protein
MAGLRSRFFVSTGSGIVARGLGFAIGATAVCLTLLPLPLMAQARTIEHPGILHKEDSCSACHGEKIRGKSVHSAMEIACTICHQAQTQGDMTLLQLELPKGEICFSCHEKTMMLREHPDAVRKLCVDCHDAHSSNRRMLLLEPLNTSRGNPLMVPSAAKSADGKAANQP